MNVKSTSATIKRGISLSVILLGICATVLLTSCGKNGVAPVTQPEKKVGTTLPGGIWRVIQLDTIINNVASPIILTGSRTNLAWTFSPQTGEYDVNDNAHTGNNVIEKGTYDASVIGFVTMTPSYPANKPQVTATVEATDDKATYKLVTANNIFVLHSDIIR